MKYISPFPLPSPYERELLTILIEECAEVSQRATKLLRFGAMEIQPGQPLTNLERLSGEIGDLRLMVTKLAEADLIDNLQMGLGMRRKREQLAKFMQTEPT